MSGRSRGRKGPEGLQEQRVPVLGAGVSGRAAASLLEKRGLKPEFFDERSTSARNEFHPRRGEYPFAIISPGFTPHHPWRARAVSAGLPLLGEMELATAAWRGKLLCITGTNGKTTLTRLLEKALLADGRQAAACGNVGRPLSDLAVVFPEAEWAVCEVSSFQLHDWERPQPEAVLWTNFDEDHLDWHASLEDYFRAKWKLVQAGVPVFAGADVVASAKSFGISIPENLERVEDRPGDLPSRGLFANPPFSRLYGLALAWWIHAGWNPRVLETVAEDFTPLPHRLEKVADLEGRRFINDSKATNFHAALAGCEAAKRPIHWIGGGLSKGGDLETFARELAVRIDSADLYGATAKEMERFLTAAGLRHVRVHDRLEAAVEAAFSRSSTPATLLFSPGFASFDQFSGYAERGEVFRKSVIRLSNR